MKSAFDSRSILASGKCQGELKVSVRARCCSAMTRREMRYEKHGVRIQYSPGNQKDGMYRSQQSVHEFVHLCGTH